MPEDPSLSDRLKKGLDRIDAGAAGGVDAEVLSALRRSVVRSMDGVAAGTDPRAAKFRVQLSGATPLVFQGSQALPLEISPLSRLLRSMDLELRSGECLEMDGGLAAWMIQSEVNRTDSDLRRAEESLRVLKAVRERDQAATQTADTLKTRLRSRLSLLVSALQAAKTDAVKQ